MANVKQSWINKYGEVIGLSMWEERKKRSSCTIDSFIKKYGDVEGRLKYESWKSNLTESKTLNGYIKKYGDVEGRLKYEEKNLKLSVSVKSLKLNGKTDEEILQIRKNHAEKSKITLDVFKQKYGSFEGEKKWNDRINKSKISSKRSLGYWIKKNEGNIEKAKNDLSNHQRRDKNFYIKKYGDVKGTEKYNIAKMKRFLGGFIEPCSKFQKEIENYIKEICNDVFINGHENCYCFFTENKLKQSVVIPDILIYDLKLIIECFGDYWHCSEKYNDDFFHEVIKKTAKEIRMLDKKRLNFFETRGFKTIVIWESEWENKKELLKEQLKYEIIEKRNK